jgi:hypothetical protein
MGGKAALFLVIGFSLLFIVMGRSISNLAVRAVDNSMLYFTTSNAHSIALAGANIAASKVFFDNSWTAGYNNIPFDGGHYTVTVEEIDPDREIIKITSVGTFKDSLHTVEIKLQPSSFSRFAYFSNKEKIGSSTIWWTDKDTVWGPFHTNDEININGDPVFQGRATSYEGRNEASGSNPEFNGGYDQATEELPIPEDGVDSVGAHALADGLYFDGQDTVYFEFRGDSLNFKYGEHLPDTTLYLPDRTNNGTIFAEGAIVRLKGSVGGKYTIGVSETPPITVTSGYWKWNRRRRRYDWIETTSEVIKGGKVYLDDDIVYNDNPLLDDKVSDDLLGIVAENEIYITDNAANKTSINIHAAMYSQNKGFGAENHDSRGPSGYINLLGGITQESRMAVGTFSGSSIVSGFSKRYYYDDRLMVMSPPSFPGTGNFEVVSWFE